MDQKVINISVSDPTESVKVKNPECTCPDMSNIQFLVSTLGGPVMEVKCNVSFIIQLKLTLSEIILETLKGNLWDLKDFIDLLCMQYWHKDQTDHPKALT